jgi:peptidoglycan DL-endopeptidase CwlO
VQRSRPGSHAGAGTSADGGGVRSHRKWTRATVVAAAVAAASIVLPAASGVAAQRQPVRNLKSLVAEAKKLSNQINALSEQYDGLRIELTQARTQEHTAAETAARDAGQLGAGQLQVGHLAAESYMSGSVDPTLQFISSSNPEAVVNRASIMLQLDQEKGAQVSALSAAENNARRAKSTATQQASVVTKLVKQIQGKRDAIQSKINVLNGAAFRQAMAVFSQTGSFPLVNIPGGNTLGEQALRLALTRRGDPYVWGAAGPNEFDCSGLVMWAYGQLGIHLDHYTGDQWNEGVHVSRSQLQPGDLLFFYDIQHVGLYIGGNLMVDAPDFGQDVMVQQIDWGAFNGAVRIV